MRKHGAKGTVEIMLSLYVSVGRRSAVCQTRLPQNRAVFS